MRGGTFLGKGHWQVGGKGHWQVGKGSELLSQWKGNPRRAARRHDNRDKEVVDKIGKYPVPLYPPIRRLKSMLFFFFAFTMIKISENTIAVLCPLLTVQIPNSRLT